MTKNSSLATVTANGGDMDGIDVPQQEIERSLRALKGEKVWMNYDQESDSLTMSFTGQPVHGLNVQMGEDHHIIVDPLSQRVVGLYLEHVVYPGERNQGL
jgi:hypothetical protein